MIIRHQIDHPTLAELATETGFSCALITSGLPVIAPMVRPHWQIDTVFAATSGDHSIRSICGAPLSELSAASPASHCPAARDSVVICGRELNRLGLGLLSNLDLKPPVQRYERERPSDLLHVDVMKLTRFREVGHCITGNRQQSRSAGVGYDRVHVTIDETTRLAYIEVLPDEQQGTAIRFKEPTDITCFASALLRKR